MDRSAAPDHTALPNFAAQWMISELYRYDIIAAVVEALFPAKILTRLFYFEIPQAITIFVTKHHLQCTEEMHPNQLQIHCP